MMLTILSSFRLGQIMRDALNTKGEVGKGHFDESVPVARAMAARA